MYHYMAALHQRFFQAPDFTQLVEPGSDLQRVMEKAEKCEEKLMTRLKDEEKHLLLNLVNAQDEISSTLAIEKFILGFRPGMMLAVESLDNNDGCLTDMIERER
jgi:hypothetical protein